MELDCQATFVVTNDLMGDNLTVIQQLLRCNPIALLERIGNTKLEGAIILRRATDDNVNYLPFVQVFDKFRIKLRQVRLWYNPITFAAHIDQQLVRTHLNNHPFAQIAAFGYGQVCVCIQVLFKQFEIRRALRC